MIYTKNKSPAEQVFDLLEQQNTAWKIIVGKPLEAGWINGNDFKDAGKGPFNTLLGDMGRRFKTEDRKIIAASFALRFGWSAGVFLAPYLLYRRVPYLDLDNASLKFNSYSLFEKTAVHYPKELLKETENNPYFPISPTSPGSVDPNFINLDIIDEELLADLMFRMVLYSQPVVDALFDWSRFSKRGIWGQIYSSWGSIFINVVAHLEMRTEALPHLDALFKQERPATNMAPSFYPVRCCGVTQLYHARASCCLYYKLPQGGLCASCPLISQEERLVRNKDWMKQQLQPG